jgi:hypothetical protein
MKKKYIVIIAIGIFLIWAGSAAAIYRWVEEKDRGTFGDMFGAVNALFSGFAFAGLIYTIAVQRQELSLQREAIQMQTEELKMQREETARSADQLEGQKKLLNLQTAMSVVNDLIQIKNKRIEELLVAKHDFFAVTFTGLVEEIKKKYVHPTEDTPLLQSYINTFFFVLDFIQKYDLENHQKDMLSNLVSMNTTDDELELIYIAVRENQHRLMMLKVHGFYPRHKKIIENNEELPFV